MSTEDIRAKLNEPFNPAKHNALVDLAARNTWSGGANVRISKGPHGSTVAFDSVDGTASAPFFRATVKRVGDHFEIRFAQGRIGGVEPTIDGVAVSKKGKDGKQPALIVTDADFDPDTGVANIYFQCTVQPETFQIISVTPIAAPAKPAKQKLIANKLAGFLLRTGNSVRYDRQLFSNVGFYAANREPSGFFDPLWSWQP
jgi:hypothetical protein